MSEEKNENIVKYNNKGKLIELKLTDEFKAGLEILENTNESIFITGKAGCLGKGTEVLMYDGSFKKVENVIVGDRLMGVDSLPRNVIRLCRGREQMFWINQKKGDPYRVNGSHILSLKHVIPAKRKRITNSNGKRIFIDEIVKPKKIETINISVNDYLNLSKGSIIKKHSKGYKSPLIEFNEKKVDIEPYYFGLWLGDGHTGNINRITNYDDEIINFLNEHYGINKVGKTKSTFSIVKKYTSHFKALFNLTTLSSLNKKYIPDIYLKNSVDNRLKLLAGIIDSDGYYNGRYGYTITIANEKLANDILYLCRSLGFSSTYRKISKKCSNCKDKNKLRKCFKISFTPEIELPVLLDRKKVKGEKSKFKNRLHCGIDIKRDIIDDYYGFELDGDNLFILKDFTVTHNSGKSTLLNYFVSKTEKNVATLAFTGLAAINVGGETIHSFFGFPLGYLDPVKIKANRPDLKAKLRAVDTIIIDEISMVRADFIDGIDKSLRIYRDSHDPFGGVQMIFIGDLYQLPPIIGNDIQDVYSMYYDSPYFFSAEVFKYYRMPYLNLEKVHRQTDQRFINILNAIRGKTKYLRAALKQLNKRVLSNNKLIVKKMANDKMVSITTTNQKSKEVNDFFLSRLKNPSFFYDAYVTGDYDNASFPTDQKLELKVGCKVMFIRNSEHYVNGDIGIVKYLDRNNIVVEKNGIEIPVGKAVWEKNKYDYNFTDDAIEKKVTGKFEQYPLKLAYSFTVHKVQGQTYDNVFIDFHRGTFTSGQAYVALSRCKSFEGTYLKRPIRESDIILDKKLNKFYELFENILENNDNDS